MSETKIQWTHPPGYAPGRSWNPVRGCSRVSPGCGGGTPGDAKGGCYAEAFAARFSGADKHGKPGPFAGYAEMTPAGPRWTGRVELLPHKLAEPFSWKQPTVIFVNSMSDLFHEKLTDAEIAAVFGAMAACPEHRFIVLTKRAERMRALLLSWQRRHPYPVAECIQSAWDQRPKITMPPRSPWRRLKAELPIDWRAAWPLRNAILCVSAEDQQRWDERVPLLMETPAACRGVSVEPQLERIVPGLQREVIDPETDQLVWPDWIIQGGESGPGARPFRLEWAREMRDACRAAGVSYFLKQVSRRPFDGQQSYPCYYQDPKGGDPGEWPAGLRVRQWPEILMDRAGEAP